MARQWNVNGLSIKILSKILGNHLFLVPEVTLRIGEMRFLNIAHVGGGWMILCRCLVNRTSMDSQWIVDEYIPQNHWKCSVFDA